MTQNDTLRSRGLQFLAVSTSVLLFCTACERDPMKDQLEERAEESAAVTQVEEIEENLDQYVGKTVTIGGRSTRSTATA